MLGQPFPKPPYPPTPLKSLFNDSDVSSSIIYYISIDTTMCMLRVLISQRLYLFILVVILILQAEMPCLDFF